MDFQENFPAIFHQSLRRTYLRSKPRSDEKIGQKGSKKPSATDFEQSLRDKLLMIQEVSKKRNK